jgi:hypothetical protein
MKEWYLLGSNDGNDDNWYLIDSQNISSRDYWQPYFDNKLPSNFNVSPTKTFSYYRVVINSIFPYQGTTYAGYAGVAQLNLYSNDETMNSNFDNLLANISNKTPIAYFRAEDYENNEIPAKIGNFTAETNGVTLSNGDGNGADVSIPFLFGDTSSNVNFTVDVPTNFTVCSITRYTDNFRRRILCTQNGNWLHGHHGGKVGVAYYKTNVNMGSLTDTLFDDWIVTCGKNGSQPDRNLIANGINRGVNSGGTGGYNNIGINNNQYGETSGFAFSKVIIWDKILTDDEMETVSNYLMQYLKDGVE